MQTELKRFCREWEKLYNPEKSGEYTPLMTSKDLNSFAKKWDVVLRSVSATIPKSVIAPKRISRHPVGVAAILDMAYLDVKNRLEFIIKRREKTAAAEEKKTASDETKKKSNAAPPKKRKAPEEQTNGGGKKKQQKKKPKDDTPNKKK